MSSITGKQREALRNLIMSRSDLDELQILISEELNTPLANLVSTSSGFSVVVFKLIEKLDLDGKLLELFDIYIKRKPHLALEFIAVRDGIPFQPSRSLDPAQARGLRSKLRERRDQLNYLNVYKELHELLHNLSGIIPQIEEEAECRARDGQPIPDSTAEDLRQWVDDIGLWAAKTEAPDAPPLSVWVPRFQTAVSDFLDAEPTKHNRALEIIAVVPSKLLTSLNEKLVLCAGQLGSNALVECLDVLPIGDTGLIAAVARFRDPCARLHGLIRDHNLCQGIDDELRASKADVSVSLAVWGDIRQWLAELKKQRPNDRWISRTHEKADAFTKDPCVEKFDAFVEKFDDLFKRTDKELLKVTNELYNAARDLADALEEIR